MSVRLPAERIPELVDRYNRAHPNEDDDLNARAQRIRKKARSTREGLSAVLRWKAARIARLAEQNDAAEVQEITHLPLTTKSERVRIEVLRVLRGVDYPAASVILHFYHNDPYPILDFRALRSLGVSQPKSYSFEFWRDHVEQWRAAFARARAATQGLTKRDFDRALWQYDKDRQERSRGIKGTHE